MIKRVAFPWVYFEPKDGEVYCPICHERIQGIDFLTEHRENRLPRHLAAELDMDKLDQNKKQILDVSSSQSGKMPFLCPNWHKLYVVLPEQKVIIREDNDFDEYDKYIKLIVTHLGVSHTE